MKSVSIQPSHLIVNTTFDASSLQNHAIQAVNPGYAIVTQIHPHYCHCCHGYVYRGRLGNAR
jgi:hypothetical protein